MSRVSVEARRWRKKGRRGVSPIIATILLVAITVVLAAVLYILISGLTTSAGSKPSSVQFGSGNPSTNTVVNYDEFALSVSSGLTTGVFGLKITEPSGVAVGTGAAVVAGACAPTVAGANPFTGCNTAPAAGTWFAVLVNANGGIIASFPLAAAGTTWTLPAGETSLALTDAMSLVIISPTALVLAGSADTLAAYGTGSGSVSGSTVI